MNKIIITTIIFVLIAGVSFAYCHMDYFCKNQCMASCGFTSQQCNAECTRTCLICE